MKQTAIVAALVMIAGCATIPPETVELNEQVGDGLRAQHLALIKSLDLFFSARQGQLDGEFEDAVQSYFRALGQAAPITLTADKFDDMAADLLRLRRQHVETKKELQRMQRLLEQRLRENYLVLLQANATVSASLSAAADLDSGRGRVVARPGADRQNVLPAVFQRIDRWLHNPEDRSKANIYDDVNALLKGGSTKESQP